LPSRRGVSDNPPVKIALALLLAASALSLQPCRAAEELITSGRYPSGEPVPYILDSSKGALPRYVIILFPGGSGTVDPRMENGKLVYAFRGNFLLRSRKFIVDDQFATVTTNSTQSEQRVQAILDDIRARFPSAKVYLMGTSSGTFSTMALAGYLSDKIAGEIHTSSLNQIYGFDARKYKNRQLVVHHKDDACRLTLFSSAKGAHEKYGNDFIAMEGGISVGDPCEAFAHHGYNGIERETVDAIKKWILQGG
jgi:hypothetical protein